jgi:DNA polymerase IIIc chi subunit
MAKGLQKQMMVQVICQSETILDIKNKSLWEIIIKAFLGHNGP